MFCAPLYQITFLQHFKGGGGYCRGDTTRWVGGGVEPRTSPVRYSQSISLYGEKKYNEVSISPDTTKEIHLDHVRTRSLPSVFTTVKMKTI